MGGRAGVHVRGAVSRLGALGSRRESIISWSLFFPGDCLLTAPPGFAENRQIHFRWFHSKNQNREKQMLGNGWRELVGTALRALPWPEQKWALPSALHS